LISLLILMAQRFTAAITGLFSAPASEAAEKQWFHIQDIAFAIPQVLEIKRPFTGWSSTFDF
jgi:hypothetical protein